ncbi:unnamed protein product [Victoria cruziana]
MSSVKDVDANEKEHLEDSEGTDLRENKNNEQDTSPDFDEEATLKKKYGGILPKKPPLISKDHERAFFDSADWALGKQGAPKGPLEALRPKLQPTPHQEVRSRRSAYAPADGEDAGHISSEDAGSNQ